MAYLIVFGSIAAFGAYTWLLTIEPPARLATYAYVNPVVAVLLGWALLGEAPGVREGVAILVILAAVAGVMLSGADARTPAPPSRPGGERLPSQVRRT